MSEFLEEIEDYTIEERLSLILCFLWVTQTDILLLFYPWTATGDGLAT